MVKDNDINLTFIDGKAIIIGGIGKLYYQDGFPIPMAISHLKKQGVSVSILHIADELLKNGWRPEIMIKGSLHSFTMDEITIIDKPLNKFEILQLDKLEFQRTRIEKHADKIQETPQGS